MTKSTLHQQLETLSAARYPLHMPGHKRRVPPAPGLGCYAWDLTEIDGADDLHDADGILADAMARMIDQPQLREKLSRGAKKIYQSQFTGEIFAKHVEDVYRDVLKGVSHGTK